MKKILILLLIITFALPSFAKKEDLDNEVFAGYKGNLPNIESEFEYLKPSVKSKDVIRVKEKEVKIEDLIPAPREEKMYIDIIKKKDKTSNYIHDVNDIIKILEKIKVSIIQNAKTQVFNAQVSYFIDLAYHLQTQYGNQPESSYISYKKIMELSNHSYSVASLRREATYYGKYLSYSKEGYIYSPEYINEQTQVLLNAINEALPILKEIE